MGQFRTSRYLARGKSTCPFRAVCVSAGEVRKPHGRMMGTLLQSKTDRISQSITSLSPR
jgi:hypothetical protein